MLLLMMSEHRGYWRGREQDFLLIWHSAQISFKQNPSHSKLLPSQLMDRSAPPPYNGLILKRGKGIFLKRRKEALYIKRLFM